MSEPDYSEKAAHACEVCDGCGRVVNGPEGYVPYTAEDEADKYVPPWPVIACPQCPAIESALLAAHAAGVKEEREQIRKYRLEHCSQRAGKAPQSGCNCDPCWLARPGPALRDDPEEQKR